MTLTVGSLFAGIGGFDLAAEWMGWRTIWVSEIDPYACKVLAHRFPGAPNLGDITKIEWGTVERPEILCGGFPCQPHSFAGRRLGSGDVRDLWSEYVRSIRHLRPKYVVAENVAGLLTSDGGGFFNRVLSDLAALGYDAEWEVFSAAEVGAPHLRERVWVVAYPNRNRLEAVANEGVLREPSDDTRSAGRLGEMGGAAIWSRPCPSGARPMGVGNGIPADLDRIKALGNAIVPQCAVAGPFRRIAELEGLA